MKRSAVIRIIAVPVLGLLIYAMIPAAIGANPKKIQDHQDLFLYGEIQSLISVNNYTVFLLNDSGSTGAVIYNGTIPVDGTSVLVRGVFENQTFFGYSSGGYLEAGGVYTWYLAA